MLFPLYLAMKKLLLLTCLMGSAMGLLAQSHYSFMQRTDNYTEMTSGTVVSPAEWDDFDMTIAMPFPFKYFGNSVDSITITDDGSFFWGTGDDYLSPSGGDPVSRGANQSPISYRVDGTGNARVLKVQWPNISFYDIADSFPNDFANYQVWYYEGSHIIEFHIGSSFISEGALAEIDIFPFINDDDGVKGILLDGDPAAATPNYDIANANGLTKNPNVNTIYVFTPGFPNSVKESPLEVSISLYPNPVENQLNIHSKSGIQGIQIISVNGQVILSEIGAGNEHFVNTSMLSKGIYLIQIETDEGVVTKRFVK